VRVQLPLSTDLRAVVGALQEHSSEVYLTGLEGGATIAVRQVVDDEHELDRAESELRLELHARLRELGVFA
jgi:hypothetical protein